MHDLSLPLNSAYCKKSDIPYVYLNALRIDDLLVTCILLQCNLHCHISCIVYYVNAACIAILVYWITL